MNSVEVAVTSGNVTMTAAHATLARFDLITVTNAGVKTYTAGTAATTPVFPAIPANSVVLAAIYVDASDNVINSNQIIDKRVTVPTPSATGGWTTVSKATNEVRVSTSTLAVDSTLKFTMAANGEFRIRGGIFWSTESTNPDMKYRWAGPASPPLVSIFHGHRIPSTGVDAPSTPLTAYSVSDHVLDFTAAVTGLIYIDAIVHNGANAGDFQFQWAQNTSHADDTIVRAGSYLEWARVD